MNSTNRTRLEAIELLRFYASEIDTKPIPLKYTEIPLKNGIYDYMTKKLTPSTPNRFVTKTLNVKYDPAHTDAADEIKMFLDQVADGDIDTYKNIEEMLGTVICNHARFQKAFILYGEGGTGKSAFLKVMSEMIPPQQRSVLGLHYIATEKSATASMRDSLINICHEFDAKYIESTSTIKSIITADELTIRPMHQQAYAGKITTKMVFATNSIPKWSDDGDALKRRFLFIPFTKKFYGSKDAVASVEEKLNTPEHLSALFNIALQGLARLLENRGNYTSNVKGNALVEDMTELNDNVYGFIKSTD